jgi:hypothetical protein
MDYRGLAAALAAVAGLATVGAATGGQAATPQRTRAEACTYLSRLSKGPDPYPDAGEVAARARRQAAGLGRAVFRQVCAGKHGGEAVMDGDGAQYFGQTVDGKPEGLGVRFYADGARYVGEWKAGVREGEGVGTQADGGRYVGHWTDGKPKGKGATQYHARIGITVSDPDKAAAK